MIIQSKRVWVMGHFLEAQLEVEDGKIKNVRKAYGAKEVDKTMATNALCQDLLIRYHGAYGFDTNDAEPEGLRNWMKNILEKIKYTASALQQLRRQKKY